MSAVSRSDFKNMKRVLVKVGTSVVTHSSGAIALPRIAFIVEQITRLIRRGVSVILVSSGSIGIGKQKLGHHLDPAYEKSDIFMRSFAATGQSGLMGIYEYMFSYYKVQCAQILITDADFNVKERKQNLKKTLNTLMEYNVVPILNENDVISTRKTPYREDEGDALKILWDNDSLACLVSIELKMNLVILLTDVDGLYKKLPTNGASPEVIDIYNRKQSGITIGKASRVGRGGMQAKIDNALDAVHKGVSAVVIASGKKQDSIDRIMNGENVGTLFVDQTLLTQIQLNPSEIAVNARNESRKLVQLCTEERKNILLNIANALKHHRDIILAQNRLDLETAHATKLNKQLLHRLKLTHSKLETVISGIVQIANYEEPIGKTLREMQLSASMNLRQITTPIGVLLVIFESRPDVLPQVIALSVKSGNGLLLKGGSEAFHSNKILYDIISNAISQATSNRIVGNQLINLIETRKDIKSLLSLDKAKIDLIIPRGSMKFVKFIEDNTSIPVLGHSAGVCHLYINRYANVEKALKILIDAKTNYPSACNAAETLLMDQEFAELYVKDIIDVLGKNNVEIKVGAYAKKHCNELSVYPMAKSCKEEYGDLCITIEIVRNIGDAVEYINRYSSHHTDSIVTENEAERELFLNTVDSACVFCNASTRFADGYRFGLGAEVGISTNRIHARGPVGIDGLLTTKWVLRSNECDLVEQYQKRKKQYIHKLVQSKI